MIALVVFMENPLPKRKHSRLDHFDYSTSGAYFITICTHKRRCLLSRVVGRGLLPPKFNIPYTAKSHWNSYCRWNIDTLH